MINIYAIKNFNIFCELEILGVIINNLILFGVKFCKKE
jgi:hypothetical protein